MAARIHRSGAKVLVAVDQTSEVIEELGRLLPELHQVLIAHGSQRPEVLRDIHRIEHRDKRALCVWGESDVHVYNEFVANPVICNVIGSLRNADFIRRNPPSRISAQGKSLLFVSQYSGQAEEDGTSGGKRDQILRTLKNHVCRYCVANNLPLTIALRPPVSAPHAPGQIDAERRHYERVFEGVRLNSTDPSRAYSTHLASDEADVTIGVPSGALTESFGRGNRVLMIRQTPSTGTYYGFPIEGDWLLTEPTYEEFAARLDELRAATREDCAAQWQVAREYVVANAETDSPIELVRSQIARALSSAT